MPSGHRNALLRTYELAAVSLSACEFARLSAGDGHGRKFSCSIAWPYHGATGRDCSHPGGAEFHGGTARLVATKPTLHRVNDDSHRSSPYSDARVESLDYGNGAYL